MSRDRPRPVSAFVHGADGPVVVVPARIAWELVERAGLRTFADRSRGRDEERDNVLRGLIFLAQWWAQEGSASASGSTVDAPAEVAPRSVSMSTRQAADQLGVTDRAVRLACASGRLPAAQTDGRWRIAPADLEHYRRARVA